MKTIKIKFPSMTAKEIMEECDNKIDGSKLLYNTDWYTNEPFFTTEKTRERTLEIDLELTHGGKSWQECKTALESKGDEMLNFAEYLYVISKSKEFRELFRYSNDICYTWTSSRAGAGSVSCVGYFGGGGLLVNGWDGCPSGDVGVGASRNLALKSRNLESFEPLSLHSLEKRLEKLENWARKLNYE